MGGQGSTPGAQGAAPASPTHNRAEQGQALIQAQLPHAAARQLKGIVRKSHPLALCVPRLTRQPAPISTSRLSRFCSLQVLQAPGSHSSSAPAAWQQHLRLP